MAGRCKAHFSVRAATPSLAGSSGNYRTHCTILHIPDCFVWRLVHWLTHSLQWGLKGEAMDDDERYWQFIDNLILFMAGLFLVWMVLDIYFYG